MITTTLDAPRPFSLKAVALSHGWHECAPLSWCEGGRCLQWITRWESANGRRRKAKRSASRSGGKLRAGEVMDVASGDNDGDLDVRESRRRTREGKDVYRVSVVEGRPRRAVAPLHVTIEGPDRDDGLVERIRGDLGTMLKLDLDLSEFYGLCSAHPKLHVLERIGAGRSIRSASMTENVLKMICGTNVNWDQAVQMINRLAQRGPFFPHYRHLNAWPGPREIRRSGEEYLTGVCRVGYRSKSILALCERIIDGTFDPDDLDEAARRESTDELLRRLRSIHGVGASSAHALLSMLGHHDRLSIDSSTVWHVSRVYTGGRKPSVKEIEQIYEPYGRWKNLIWWYEMWIDWKTARGMMDGERGRF
ncbi:MAG: hypothetical protein C4547_03420 [Phycisphaerales bacterium]|nr:MAG: hypothetical protein C4547_03420 [Phycisphaerales bacterium]